MTLINAFDVDIWPRYSQDVPAYQNEVSGSRLSKVKTRTGHTDRHRQTDRQKQPNALLAAFTSDNDDNHDDDELITVRKLSLVNYTYM